MKDGYALASEVRALYPDALIIFLTGNSETEERVQGLRFGADDYITKPFSLEELALRIRNVLRRSSSQNDAYSDEHYDFAGWTFHVNVRECVKDGQKISLTHTEAQLLRMFCHHPEHILYKEEALRVIWADDQHLHGESLKVYVSRLRRLFKSEPRIEFLNLHGKGYRMIIR